MGRSIHIKRERQEKGGVIRNERWDEEKDKKKGGQWNEADGIKKKLEDKEKIGNGRWKVGKKRRMKTANNN